MAKEIINTGKSQNKGDGDPLRTAFDKVNDNFSELYSGTFTDTTDFTTSIIPRTDNEISLGSSTKRWSELYVKDLNISTKLEKDYWRFSSWRECCICSRHCRKCICRRQYINDGRTNW